MSEEKPPKAPRPPADEPTPPKFDIIGKHHDTAAQVEEFGKEACDMADDEDDEDADRSGSRARRVKLVDA